MNISFTNIQFSNEKVPNFVEPKPSQLSTQPYVKYGEKNDYPNFLIDLFNRSAKHNAIVTAKQMYIAGQGINANYEGLDENQIANIQAIISSVNPYETLEQLIKKIALDIELFGGCYLHVVYTKNKKKVAAVYHLDYTTVRSNTDNSEFYVSENWLREDGTENTKPDFKIYKPFGTIGVSECVLYFKEYRPQLKTYTLPSYIGAIPAIITDAEIANFHRASIQNGFVGGNMIVFKNGIPSDEEMRTVENQIKKKFTGTDKANSLVVVFTDGDPNRTPEIISLTGNDFDKKYEQLNKTIQEEIFVGHRITSPMLFGVRVEGQLGGRNELATAFQLFQNTYITPKQLQIERLVNELFGLGDRLSIKKIEPVLPEFSEGTLMQILDKNEMREIIGRKPIEVSVSQTNDKINSLSPLVANSVLNNMTVNEKRAILGLPPIEGGDTIESQVEAQPQALKKQINEDAIALSVFSKYGVSESEYEFVSFEKDILSRQEFALTKNEKGVLDILNKAPDTKISGIAKLLNISESEVKQMLERLTEKGYLEAGKPTKKVNELKLPDFEETFVMYKYDLRIGIDGPKILPDGRTRPFCEAMIRAGKLYTREDIDMISKELGAIYGIPNYDAFRLRGGWYHDPDSGVNYPFCRHVWKQGIYKRKKK